MSAPDLVTVLGVVRANRNDARSRFLIDCVGVAGSVARGEARETSDVDLVVDFLPGTTLFKIGGFLNFMQDQLGTRVDVLDRDSLGARMRAEVDRELVPV